MHGFFDTEHHQISWHYETHKAIRLRTPKFNRPSEYQCKRTQNGLLFLFHNCETKLSLKQALWSHMRNAQFQTAMVEYVPSHLQEWVTKTIDCPVRPQVCVTTLTLHHRITLTHWPLGDLNVFLKMQSSILLYLFVSSKLLMIMSSDECHRIYRW